MTKRQKLIDKIVARPPEADFRDVAALLEDFGWTIARQRGSHVTFTKTGERTIGVRSLEAAESSEPTSK